MNREPQMDVLDADVPDAATQVTAPVSPPDAPDSPNAAPLITGRSIGDFIREACQLSAEQVEQVLAHQRQHGVMFGEAAVALNMATSDVVMWALSQQFRYPYSAEGKDKLNPELVVAREPFSEQAELFRAVRAQMARKLQALPQRAALAVVSPDSGDGKTYFAANLALAFSQLGRRTLLVDADLRNPRQHEVFGIDNSQGLSAALAGRQARVVQPLAGFPSLSVVSAGTLPPNPLELVEHAAFAALMQDLIAQYDHVIVDTPALSHGADATVIAARCGAALAIARQGRSKLDTLKDLVAMLREDATQVLGVLVTQH